MPRLERDLPHPQGLSVWYRESGTTRYPCVYVAEVLYAIGENWRIGWREGYRRVNLFESVPTGELVPEHWTLARTRRFLWDKGTAAALDALKTLDRQAKALRNPAPGPGLADYLAPLAPQPCPAEVRLVRRRDASSFYISAYSLHGWFQSGRRFANWLDYRNRQGMRIPGRDGRGFLLLPKSKLGPSGRGRHLCDYLLTTAQVRQLAALEPQAPETQAPLTAFLDRLDARWAALQALEADFDAARARYAQTLDLAEGQTIGELLSLLAGWPDTPQTRRGWEKRAQDRRWSRLLDATGPARYTPDADTAEQLRQAIAGHLLLNLKDWAALLTLPESLATRRRSDS
ncbi:MAG: hypothetical protein HYV16_14040 [Gammaproteobacteria bacterium]|nr:hypothetical protein [Gammaproteobacteria bacterium]